MKQTKAERLFFRNYAMCRRHIEHWGFEGIGFSGIDCDETETTPTRTCNAIQKQINGMRRHLEKCVQFGIGENIEIKMQALEMLQITLDNQRKSNARFAAELKAI